MNKVYAIIGVIMLICMLIIPLIAVKSDIPLDTKPVIAATATKNTEETQKPTVGKEEDKVKLLNTDDKVIKVSVEDYLLGVVACEMPASFESEALKAQAVAAYTMYLYRKNENKDKEYEITGDSLIDQGYLDKEKRKEKWSANFDKHEQKIKESVKKVLNQAITYKDSPILAAYHSISGGRTENAKNVWNIDLPYLKPVESVSDMLCTDYISTVTYTKDEFISLATNLNLKLSGEVKDFISEPKCTESGTVSSYKLGEKEFSGQQIRKAFNLRSANFDIAAANDNIVFTVRGYGHGVGLSQNGANYMAKQGSNYKEIINWYYSECKIQQISG